MFLGAVAALMLLSLSVPFWRQMLFPPRGCGSGTSACKSNLKNIGTALEMYSSDHGGEYPPSLATLSPEYLKRIPECPLAGQDTYSPSYNLSWAPTLPREISCPSHGNESPCRGEAVARLAIASYQKAEGAPWPLTVEGDGPACPVSGQPLSIEPPGRAYEVFCQGHHHRTVLPRDYPRYNGLQGLVELP
jgi:hypothetical protein